MLTGTVYLCLSGPVWAVHTQPPTRVVPHLRCLRPSVCALTTHTCAHPQTCTCVAPCLSSLCSGEAAAGGRGQGDVVRPPFHSDNRNLPSPAPCQARGHRMHARQTWPHQAHRLLGKQQHSDKGPCGESRGLGVGGAQPLCSVVSGRTSRGTTQENRLTGRGRTYTKNRLPGETCQELGC